MKSNRGIFTTETKVQAEVIVRNIVQYRGSSPFTHTPIVLFIVIVFCCIYRTYQHSNNLAEVIVHAGELGNCQAL